MNDPKKRLISLIRDAAERKGCSKSQISQIVALVNNTIADGVPEMNDLEQILKSIGGVN